jgi:hypothetical protein
MATPPADTSAGTLTDLDTQRQAQISELQQQKDYALKQSLAQIRGEMIARGLQGSSFENQAIQQATAESDQQFQNAVLGVNTTFDNSKLGVESQNSTQTFTADQQAKQDAIDAANAKSQAKSGLFSNATTLGAAYLLAPKAAAAVPAVAGAAAPGAAGAAPGLFGSLSKPLAGGLSKGAAGVIGQVAGAGLSTAAGADLGQMTTKKLFGSSYNKDKAVSRGGKAGSLVGAGIGTYFGGPLGGAVGGAVGGAAGANFGKGLRDVTGGKAITLGNIGTGIWRSPGKAIGATLLGDVGVRAEHSVAKAVKNIFCFLPDTPVEMAGDKTKKIGDVKLGDATLGGFVYSIRRSISGDLFDYKGIKVTGSHAVLEDGKWIRVHESPHATEIPGTFEVVSLVTSRNRIYSLGVTMADEHENEDYEHMTIEESLEALNEQEVRRGA